MLTSLNLLNYVDRSVLFAVQPLVQAEFHVSNAQLGYLTSAFLGCYMVAAPFTGPLAGTGCSGSWVHVAYPRNRDLLKILPAQRCGLSQRVNRRRAACSVTAALLQCVTIIGRLFARHARAVADAVAATSAK